MKFTSVSSLYRTVSSSLLPFTAALLLGAALAWSSTGFAQRAGDLDATFNPRVEVNGFVSAIGRQADGKSFIGGAFSRIGGIDRSSLARLNADGSLDTNFVPPANLASVIALGVRSDGKVVVIVEAFSATDRSYAVVRLNANGSLDTSFSQVLLTNANDDTPEVIAPLPDGKTLVGGPFSTVNGAARPGIVRLNADGGVDTSFNARSGPAGVTIVYSLAPQTDGKVVASGAFLGLDSTIRSIFRLNADGSLDTSFTAPNQRGAFGLVLQADGKFLYLSPSLAPISSALNGVPRRLNADGSQDASFNPQFDSSATLTALTLQPDGKALVGGTLGVTYIPDANGVINITSQHGVVRLNADGSVDASFQTVPLSVDFTALGVQPDGKILVGGRFTSFGAVSRIGSGRLNANGTVDSSFNADVTSAGSNTALSIQPDGKPIVLGNSNRINGVQTANGLLRFGADGSLDTAFQAKPIFNAGVNPQDSIAVQPDGRVIVVAQSFTLYNQGQSNIARFNADGTADNPIQTGLVSGDSYYAVAVQPDGKLLVAGYEGFEEDLPYPIVRLNAAGVFDRSFRPAADPANIGLYTNSSKIYAVALQTDGKVLAAGALKPVNGVARVSVIRLNADGSLDASFNAGSGGTPNNDFVSTLALQPDGKVVIGGSFTTVGSSARANLARLNADGSLDASFNATAQTDLPVRAIVIQADGSIVIGGDFSTVNGVTRNGVARLNANGDLDATFDPGTGTAGSSSVKAIALEPDGKIVIVGNFTRFNGQSRDGIARLHAVAVKALPTVSLEADVATAYPARGISGSFKITRTGDDVSQPLKVSFTIKGSAANGTDYKLLTLTKTIKAGKAFKRINIQAYTEGNSGIAKKTIKLTLQPADAYTLSDSTTAKVKIFYNP